MKKAPKGVSWGTTNTPKGKWISMSKKYKTRDGRVVKGIRINFKNALDNEVTFPVKGTVISYNKGPFGRDKYESMIWTLDGKASAIKKSDLDLVEIKEK